MIWFSSVVFSGGEVSPRAISLTIVSATFHSGMSLSLASSSIELFISGFFLPGLSDLWLRHDGPTVLLLNSFPSPLLHQPADLQQVFAGLVCDECVGGFPAVAGLPLALLVG
jgi:hypothetical protein